MYSRLKIFILCGTIFLLLIVSAIGFINPDENIPQKEVTVTIDLKKLAGEQNQ